MKRFTNRQTAVTRIWAAVQRLVGDSAQPARDVAPAAKPAKKVAGKAPRRARAPKGASESRTNKKAEVIAMLKRAKGATLPEIMEHTGWQKHTVRGFISILGSKGGGVREERLGRAHVPHREVARKTGKFASLRRFRLRPGRRFPLCWGSSGWLVC